MFEAVRGSGYLGDIAIDDIVFPSFKCANIPANSVPPDPTTQAPTTVTTTPQPTPSWFFFILFTEYSIILIH